MKYALVLLLASLSLFGCSESKKVQKAIDTLNAHPEKAAEYCGNKFPPRDSVVTKIDTLLLKAENKDYSAELDSIQKIANRIGEKAYSDSLSALESHQKCRDVVAAQSAENNKLRNEITSLKSAYKPCVPDTLVKTVSHYIANTAKEKSLEGQLSVSNSNLVTVTDKFSWWKRACLITWAILVLYIGLKVFGKRINLPI